MQLDPIPPVAASTDVLADPIRHGATGSAARLAVLRFLAPMPMGARRAAIAAAAGLDMPTTIHVLTMLRQAGRVACDRRSTDSMWFVPCARAMLGPSARARLREQAERLDEAERDEAAHAQAAHAQAVHAQDVHTQDVHTPTVRGTNGQRQSATA